MQKDTLMKFFNIPTDEDDADAKENKKDMQRQVIN